MSPDVIWLAVGSFAGVAGVALSAFALWRTTKQESGKAHAAMIRKAVSDGLAPLEQKLNGLETRISINTDKLAGLATDVSRQGGQAGDMGSKLAVLEAKMEVFWRSVGLDAAKILHSPHPERAHVDALLEAFMAGTITDAEKHELLRVLEEIRDYSPGKPVPDFPVQPGEQVAAAILLRSMEYAGR